MNADADSTTVIYASRYGTTASYARALAARLGTRAVELDGTVIAGSGPLVVLAPVYVSRPLRRRRVLAALTAGRHVAVVLVGISPLDDDARAATARRLLTAASGRADRRDRKAPISHSDAADPTVEVFQLRGAYDPAALGPVDRLLMMVMRRRLRGSDDPAARAIVAGESIDCADGDALDPIVQWVQRVRG